MKKCWKCKEEKKENCFAKNSHKLDGLQTACKDCKKILDKIHYTLNKVRMRKQIDVSQEKRRKIAYQNLFKYLLEHPCVDCLEKDPLVLEFDHFKDKKVEVSKLISSGYVWQTILKEIEKCEVRCANCHKRKTAKQFFVHKMKWCTV